MALDDRFWQQVFDAAPVALSLIDPYGRQIAGNRAYADMLGCTTDQLRGIDVGSITLPDDQEWTASYLARLVSGDLDQFATMKTYRRADGSTLTARLSSVAIRSEDGRCVALLGAIEPTPVSEKLSDGRARTLLGLSTSAIAVIDRDGRIMETSGRYRSLLGYPATYWEGRSVFDLVEPEDQEAVSALVQRVLREPGLAHVGELRLRAADGSTRVMVLEAVNALDDPELEGVLVTAFDVTEQRAQVADLQARQATAEAIVQARTTLLATVSHELRNPLHAVQGLAELLNAEPLPPQAATLAATLAQQLTGLASVTEDLLDAARVDSGHVSLTEAPVDVRALIDEVVVYGRTMAGDRPLAVASSVAPEVPRAVLADGGRLRQILRNLVGNAVKFTSAGSVVLDVRRRSDGALVLAVIDTGPGIAHEEQGRVLKAFETGGDPTSARGAGLGLAIVQRLVAAMRGEFELHSEPGRGTTIRLALPLAAVAETEPQHHSSGLRPPVAVTGTGTDGVRVLVVEDNAVNQQLARSQLARLGADATIVGSGEEAIEILEQSPPGWFDVVLMDVQLPGIDGAETTRRIRQMDPPTGAVRVMGVTASATLAARARFVDVGMDGFVSKPASLDDIRKAITVTEKPVRDPRIGAPQKAPEPPAGPLVEVGRLDVLSEEFGDEQVVVELVQAFLGELSSRVGAIGSALTDGDAAAARKAGHALAVSAALLGADALAGLCRSVERSGTGDLAELDRITEGSRTALRNWLHDRGVA